MHFYRLITISVIKHIKIYKMKRNTMNLICYIQLARLFISGWSTFLMRIWAEHAIWKSQSFLKIDLKRVICAIPICFLLRGTIWLRSVHFILQPLHLSLIYMKSQRSRIYSYIILIWYPTVSMVIGECDIIQYRIHTQVEIKYQAIIENWSK